MPPFGVPLHAKKKGTRLVHADGFDGAVGGLCLDAQARRQPVDGLENKRPWSNCPIESSAARWFAGPGAIARSAFGASTAEMFDHQSAALNSKGKSVHQVLSAARTAPPAQMMRRNQRSGRERERGPACMGAIESNLASSSQRKACKIMVPIERRTDRYRRAATAARNRRRATNPIAPSASAPPIQVDGSGIGTSSMSVGL